MTIDMTTPRSRRALLGAAIGAIAASTAAAVGRAAPVRAADDDPVLLGHDHTATSPTRITNTTAQSIAFKGTADHGIAIYGQTDGGRAVEAISKGGSALWASSETGVVLRLTGGRIQIHQVSGIATIRKGRRSVTISPGVEINPQTFVLLTPMANIGSRSLWFTKAPARGRIVIHLSSPRTANTKVAWLALERG